MARSLRARRAAVRCWLRGDLAGAEEDFRTAEDEFELYGYGGLAPAYLAGFLSAAQRERDDLTAARQTLDAVTP